MFPALSVQIAAQYKRRENKLFRTLIKLEKDPKDPNDPQVADFK